MSLLKKSMIVVVVALGLLAVSWGVVFASAEALLEVYPASGETVSSATPRFTAKWLAIPGVRIKSLRLILDGQESELDPPASGTGFAYEPDEDLAEGEHEVRLVVVYAMGAAREIDTTWKFTVDTEPPALALESGEPFFVSPAPEAEVSLVSEPGVRLDARFNDKEIEVGSQKRDGGFDIGLKGLADRGVLMVTAADSVGNHRSLTIPVILDETTPIIESFIPAEGEVVREAAPKVEVVFSEGESGMRSIELSIDGTTAVTKNDDGTGKLTYLGELLTDGEHTATVSGTDYAGRKVEKEWTFSIDTRRIVISRYARRLYYYRNGKLQRVYGVAVGMPRYPTPGGSWRVVNKQVNPSWHNPGSDWAKDMPPVIGPSWSNPLGVRAMALDARNILIHGTSNYGSIGTAASHGCIRMRNSDIINFFPQIGIGVPVDII